MMLQEAKQRKGLTDQLTLTHKQETDYFSLLFMPYNLFGLKQKK